MAEKEYCETFKIIIIIIIMALRPFVGPWPLLSVSSPNLLYNGYRELFPGGKAAGA
jgi:hypothetical protein